MQIVDKLTDKRIDNAFDMLMYDATLEGKELTLATKGNSMEPLAKEGDKISFKRVDISELKWSDLVVLRKDNGYFAHRFIKTIHNNGHIYIISKADILRKYDNPVAEKDFVGVITKIEREGKVIFLNTFKGRLKSYINIAIAPLYLFINTIRPKKRIEYFKDENELIVLTLAETIDSIDKTRALVSKELNWDYVAEKIKWNFVAPFFLRNIVNNGLKNMIPEIVLERVKTMSYLQIYHDTKIRFELKNILRALGNDNIKIIILKGAHLGEEVYGDTYLRRLGDVDILARVDDFTRIKGVMKERGFESGEMGYDDWGLKYLDNHITFFKDDIKVEVKFNIWAMDFPYFNNDYWKNAREILIDGEKAYAPSLEDTLLISCCNLVRHNYAGLIWHYDVMAIIGKFGKTINWDALIKRAKENDMDSIVYYSLYYSGKLLNYKISEDIFGRLKPSFNKRCLHRFFWNEEKILWEREEAPARGKIAFEMAILLFGGKISIKPKKLLRMILYIGNVIMPNRVHLSKRYGAHKDSPILMLCYLLEPFRFVFLILNTITAVVFGRLNK